MQDEGFQETDVRGQDLVHEAVCASMRLGDRPPSVGARRGGQRELYRDYGDTYPFR